MRITDTFNVSSELVSTQMSVFREKNQVNPGGIDVHSDSYKTTGDTILISETCTIWQQVLRHK